MNEKTETQKLLESKKLGILEQLHKGVVDLQFKKVNGGLRNMMGTLKEELIPEKDRPSADASERVVNDNIVVLYDLQVEGWRSFRVENLVEYRGRSNG